MADGYVLLFGGITVAGTSTNQTWTLSNGHWTQLHPSKSPTARNGASMAYDALDQYVLLFGGYNLSGSYWSGDTWEFSAGTWIQRSPPNPPPPTGSYAMAYSPHDREVVMFGGSPLYTNATWAFSFGHWAKVNGTGPIPPGGGFARMTWDPARDALLMFGGTPSSGTAPTNQTWQFAGGNWTHVLWPYGPTGRMSPGFAFDSQLNGDILYGGWQAWGNRSASDTWLLSPTGWQNLSLVTDPGPRDAVAMAYDPTARAMFLFGGNDDPTPSDNVTWRLQAFDVGPAQVANATVDAQQPTTLSVNVTGGTGRYSYLWAGLPGCPSADSSSLICVPTQNGTFHVFVQVTDPGLGQFLDSDPARLTVDPALTVMLTGTPHAVDVNATLAVVTTAQGGGGTYQYQYENLPPGCAGSNSASLACRPTSAGQASYPIHVNVSDSNGEVVGALWTEYVALSMVVTITGAGHQLGAGVAEVLTAHVSYGVGPILRYVWTANGSHIGGNGSTLVYPPSGTYPSGSVSIAITVLDSGGGNVSSAPWAITLQGSGTPPASLLGSPAFWLGAAIGLAVLVAAVGVIWELRRRRRTPSEPSP